MDMEKIIELVRENERLKMELEAERAKNGSRPLARTLPAHRVEEVPGKLLAINERLIHATTRAPGDRWYWGLEIKKLLEDEAYAKKVAGLAANSRITATHFGRMLLNTVASRNKLSPPNNPSSCIQAMMFAIYVLRDRFSNFPEHFVPFNSYITKAAYKAKTPKAAPVKKRRGNPYAKMVAEVAREVGFTGSFRNDPEGYRAVHKLAQERYYAKQP